MDKDTNAIFSQLDSRWAKKTLGATPYTIGSWGCTITSLCRLLFKLNEVVMTPDEIVQKLSFTSQGLLIWSSLSAVGLKGVRGYGKPDFNKIGEVQEMLLELNYKPLHWVALEDTINDNPMIMDPLDAQMKTKNASEVSGYCIITSTEKKEPEPTEYEIEVEAAKKWYMENGLSNGERPTEPLLRQDYWIMRKREMEYLKKQMEQ